MDATYRLRHIKAQAERLHQLYLETSPEPGKEKAK
jgi:hypothetical protein